MRHLPWFPVVAASLGLAACGGSTVTPPQPQPIAQPVTTAAPVPSASATASATAPVAPVPIAPVPLSIVKVQRASGGLLAESGQIYFFDEADGSVNNAEARGRAVVNTLSTLSGATTAHLAMDGAMIYLAVKTTDGRVQKIDKGGGAPPATLAPSIKQDIRGLAVDASSVYWIAGTFVMKTSKSPGSPAAAVAGGAKDPTGLAVDDSGVYWTTDGAVLRLARGAATPTVFAPSQPAASHVVLDASNVYWAAGGKIVRAAKSSGAAEAIADAGGAVTSVAVDGTHVYWAAVAPSGEGSILRVATSGGAPETVAAKQSGPVAVALDAQNVYFTVRGTEAKQFRDGAIFMLPKGR